MTNVGYATLSVIPSAKGFGAALSRDVDPQMHATGLTAGKLLAGGLLAGAAVVAVGLAAVIKTGVGEAMDASAGTAQLAAGIKSTGNAANVSVDGLNALASSIQKYSGQTDDSIVKSQSLLLTFTNIKNRVGAGNDVFDQATKATANMAAKMGGDAAGSAILLGKALNDPIKGMASLGRAGVQFTDAQKATITALVKSGDTMGAQKIILAELETQFGGAAEAAGKSLPGQLEIAKRSFEDVSQAVVEGLLPVVLPAITKIGDVLTSKVIPAVSVFVQGFRDGTGPGGRLRDVLTEVNDKGLVPLSTFITGTALPALKSVSSWVTDTGVPALSRFKDWVEDNKTTLAGFATFITITLLPVFVDMAVTAVASAATQAAAWVSTSAGGVTSAASQLVSHYVVVGGWIASAAAAVASGATSAYIWGLYALDAVKGAAKVVAAHATVVGGWIASAATSVASAATIAGGWIMMAATAMASGVRMAAAWLIGLGPIGWIIAAIVAVGAAFVWLYNNVGWFRDGVNAAWAAIKSAFSVVVDWLVKAWNDYVYGLSKIPEAIGAIFKGVGSFITAPFRAAFNEVSRLWNNTVGGMAIAVPDWVPGIGGKTFSLPRLPSLAAGATILPTPGGTVVRVAEAGRAESVVDTGKLNRLLDRANGGGGGGDTYNIYETVSAEATAKQVARRQNALGAV